MKKIIFSLLVLVFSLLQIRLASANDSFAIRENKSIKWIDISTTSLPDHCKTRFEVFCDKGNLKIYPEQQKKYKLLQETYPECASVVNDICSEITRENLKQIEDIEIQRKKELTRVKKYCNKNLKIPPLTIEHLSSMVRVHPNSIEIKRFEIEFSEERLGNEKIQKAHCKMVFYTPKGANSVWLEVLPFFDEVLVEDLMNYDTKN